VATVPELRVFFAVCRKSEIPLSALRAYKDIRASAALRNNPVLLLTS